MLPYCVQTNRLLFRHTDCCNSKGSQLELNRPLLCLSLLISGSLVDIHQRRDRSRASSGNPKDCPIINVTGLEPIHLTFLSSPTVHTVHHIMITSKYWTNISNMSEALKLSHHSLLKGYENVHAEQPFELWLTVVSGQDFWILCFALPCQYSQISFWSDHSEVNDTLSL